MEKVYEILGYFPQETEDVKEGIFEQNRTKNNSVELDEIKLHFSTLLYCSNIPDSEIDSQEYDYE